MGIVNIPFIFTHCQNRLLLTRQKTMGRARIARFFISETIHTFFPTPDPALRNLDNDANPASGQSLLFTLLNN
jgi:hypothetical protein